MSKPKFKALIFDADKKNTNTEKANGDTASNSEAVANEKSSPENDIQLGVKDLVSRLSRPAVDLPVKVVIIPRNKIVFNEKNDYEQKDIESLADSILRYRLQNIPSGYYDEESDLYVLKNGERRTRALDYLLDKYQNCRVDEKNTEEYQLYLKNVSRFENGYPFNVTNTIDSGMEKSAVETELDGIDEELCLIDANNEARSDQNERLFHIEKKKRLLERRAALLKETGVEVVETGIIKSIAESEGISERQVRKYTAVANLIPELRELFESKQISLNDGASYASLSEEDQRRIVSLLRAGEEGNAQEIQNLNEKLKQIEADKEAERKKYEEQIELLKREKEEKEQGVSLLVEATRRQAEEEKNKIRAEIEEEFRKASPDPEQVTALKNRLSLAENKEKNALAALEKERENAKKKAEEIKDLRSQLRATETKVKTELDYAQIKTEIIYKNCIDNVNKALDEFDSLTANTGISTVAQDFNALIIRLEQIRGTLQKN